MHEMKELPGTYAELNVSVQDARTIPKLAHAEATRLAADELEQMLALLESLSAEDWKLPTVCPLWNVSEMVAHLAGAAAGYTSWAELKRQFIRNPYIKKGVAKADGISQCQVEDRAGTGPTELLAELREAGPKAIRVRNRLPWVLRVVPVPLGAPVGVAPIGYLTDLIYTRDMWLHRLDICRAAGRDMTLTASHDGRIIELVMRELGEKLHRLLGKRKIKLELTGPAGGIFEFGTGSEPSATIQMDALDYNWLASGRISPDEAMAGVAVTGNIDEAEWFLQRSDVPY